MKAAERLVPWLALNRFASENLRGWTAVFRAFGDPERVLSLGWEEFRRVEGVTRQTWMRLVRFRDRRMAEARREAELLSCAGVGVLTLEDEDYPRELAEIWDPPLVLYYRGDWSRVRPLRRIAVVGSRFASPAGLTNARRLAKELAEEGLVVVSGLARGIDTEAHEGALEAGGLTVAVLGSGIDRIYPPENEGLARRIEKAGVVMTEFPMGTPPDRYNFPRRNRIISGLCEGTAVVEAARRSGALITAEFAMEQGREVFAVPGEASGRFAEGSNNLLREGAQLVTSAKDIVEALSWGRSGAKPKAAPVRTEARKEERPPLAAEEQAVLGCIGEDPRGIDEIVAGSGLSVPAAQNALLNLELNGYIRQEIGKRFRRL